MRVEMTAAYEPVNDETIDEFEKQLNNHLPPDFRKFLLMHNGGEPKPDRFDVDIDDLRKTPSIQRFLGFHDTELHSFSRYLKVYRGRVPDNLLPIAKDLSVNLICLSVSGEDYGKVYFWDHNWEVTQGEPDYSNVHFLADNFSEFLERLYDDEEDG